MDKEDEIAYPDIFMNELQLQLGRHIAATNSLLVKTSALLIVSGFSISMLIGFYNEKIHIIFFVLSIIFITSTILLSLWTFRPLKQTYPITSENYVNKAGKLDEEKIIERCKENEGDVVITVRAYLKAMYEIENENTNIGKRIKIGSITLICGFVIIYVMILYK